MKPVVIFTNFWDANSISKDGYMLHKFSSKKESLYFVRMRNYCVHSIALGIPDKSKIPSIKAITRLDYFCPTYDLLKSVKTDGNWEKYVQEYRKLLIQRKTEIEGWIETLKDDKIYILCCWENTKSGSNCHRRILYDAFSGSSKFKDKAVWAYRHGDKIGVEYFKNFTKNKDSHLSEYNALFNNLANYNAAAQYSDLYTATTATDSNTWTQWVHTVNTTVKQDTPVLTVDDIAPDPDMPSDDPFVDNLSDF